MKIPLTRLKNILRRPQKTLPFLTFGLLSLSALALLGFKSGAEPMTPVNQDLVSLKESISTLRAEVMTLKRLVAQPAVVDTREMTQQLSEVSRRLSASVTTEDQKALSHAFTASLSEAETSLSRELADVKEAVQKIKITPTERHYLPASVLPFDVLSIDSIQAVNVANLQYDFKTFPLEKGDRLAGWKIVRMNYGTQQIEFENAKKERVRLTLMAVG